MGSRMWPVIVRGLPLGTTSAVLQQGIQEVLEEPFVFPQQPNISEDEAFLHLPARDMQTKLAINNIKIRSGGSFHVANVEKASTEDATNWLLNKGWRRHENSKERTDRDTIPVQDNKPDKSEKGNNTKDIPTDYVPILDSLSPDSSLKKEKTDAVSILFDEEQIPPNTEKGRVELQSRIETKLNKMMMSTEYVLDPR